jgi:hypothetical protein
VCHATPFWQSPTHHELGILLSQLPLEVSYLTGIPGSTGMRDGRDGSVISALQVVMLVVMPQLL